MQNQLFAEIKELKTLLAKLIGTSDLPAKEQFSKDALDVSLIYFGLLWRKVWQTAYND